MPALFPALPVTGKGPCQTRGPVDRKDAVRFRTLCLRSKPGYRRRLGAGSDIRMHGVAVLRPFTGLRYNDWGKPENFAPRVWSWRFSEAQGEDYSFTPGMDHVIIGTEDLLVFEISIDPKEMDKDLIFVLAPKAGDAT